MASLLHPQSWLPEEYDEEPEEPEEPEELVDFDETDDGMLLFDCFAYEKANLDGYHYFLIKTFSQYILNKWQWAPCHYMENWCLRATLFLSL